jgi:Ca2+-dependent lipid-binding protein
MLGETKLHVTIVSDVFYACCILYNHTIKRGTVNFEELMHRMTLEIQNEVSSRINVSFI